MESPQFVTKEGVSKQDLHKMVLH